jgi:hypothetical protein
MAPHIPRPPWAAPPHIAARPGEPDRLAEPIGHHPATKAPPQQHGASDARLRQLAKRLHALGERPVYEFLREVLAGRDPVERLEAYARLPADLIRAFGGERLGGPRLVYGGRQ